MSPYPRRPWLCSFSATQENLEIESLQSIFIWSYYLSHWKWRIVSEFLTYYVEVHGSSHLSGNDWYSDNDWYNSMLLTNGNNSNKINSYQNRNTFMNFQY